MSQSPPPSGPARADQVVEVKQDPARDTDLPPPQAAEQSEANKQAHMVAAGLAAVTAAQILKREEEVSSAPLATTANQAASANHTGASLPASILAWIFLLAIGLGSIAGMVAIIIAMLR